jgi:hypothetical protein
MNVIVEQLAGLEAEARAAGVHPRRARRLVLAGKVPAVKLGTFYVVVRGSLDAFRQTRGRRKAG